MLSMSVKDKLMLLLFYCFFFFFANSQPKKNNNILPNFMWRLNKSTKIVTVLCICMCVCVCGGCAFSYLLNG